MLDIEQRVKMVEERMADHMRLFAEIKQGLLQFEERVDRRFEQIEARFASLEQKVEARFASLEQKFDAKLTGLDARLTGLEQKFDNLGLTLNAALTAQRSEMHAQFRWTAGIILTGLIAIVAAMLAR